MDEKQLAKQLAAIKSPALNESRRKQALDAALAHFDENIDRMSQGSGESDSLTDNEQTYNVRRVFMEQYRPLIRVGSVLSLAVLLSVGYAEFMAPAKEDALKSTVTAGANTADIKMHPSMDTPDIMYLNAIKKLNEDGATRMARQGGSAMPIPLAKSQGDELSVPPAPSAPQGDPLQEWRAKAEARRMASADDAAIPERDREAQKDSGGPVGAVRADKSSVMAQNMASPAPTEEVAGRIAPTTALSFSDMSPKVPQPVEKKMDEFQHFRDKLIAAKQGYAAPQEENNDAFPDYEDNPVKEVSSEPVSTFSIDVDTSSYSFMRREINEGHLPPKGSVRLEELINYFHYDYALPGKDEDPFKPTVAVFKCPWQADHKLVHIGIKGYDLTDKPKSNIVLLLDTSGSMAPADRLPLVISSFKLMLDSLKPDDMVSIVTYAGNAGVALDPTPASDKQKIVDVLNNLYSGGSTAGAEGIKTAYELAEKNLIKEGNNRVILATDGDFNVGISNQDDLKAFIAKKRDEGIFLSVLGVGQGNYHDNTMQTLAQNGNGNASYIDNLNEARKVLVEEASSTLFTIAKDVKIQVEFNPAQVSEYRLIGYETRHLNREDFNNDKIDAGEIGAGHAVTAIYEVTPLGATKVVDDLRYDAKEKALAPQRDAEDKSRFSNELAFLKIRYKKPDSDTSKLMTQPITLADEKTFDEQSDDVRFATAVAGFGQLLRQNQNTSSLSWDQVIAMANGARGKDDSGYRTEFVNLAKLAKSEAGAGSTDGGGSDK